MEEKILNELQEIKKILQDIRSILEPKRVIIGFQNEDLVDAKELAKAVHSSMSKVVNKCLEKETVQEVQAQEQFEVKIGTTNFNELTDLINQTTDNLNKVKNFELKVTQSK